MTQLSDNQFQPHSLYSAPSWQRTRGLSGRKIDSWVTVNSGTQVRAAMPLYRPAQTSNSRYSPQYLLRELDHPADARIVLGGGVSGYQCDLLVAADQEARAVGADLLSQAQRQMESDLVIVPYLTSASAAVLATVPGCVIMIEDLDSSLEQFDDGMEGFMSRVSSKQRYAIRSDMATFTDRGFCVKLHSLAGFEEDFAVLVDANSRKYGGSDDIASLTCFLQAIAGVYGSAARLITAASSGVMIGAVLAIEYLDCLYVRMLGFDYALTKDSCSYFELAFYQAMLVAQQSGLRRVHLGIEMNGTKSTRGAKTRPLWTAVYGLGARDVRLANRHRLLGMCARVPGKQARSFTAEVAQQLVRMGTEGGITGAGDR